VVLPVLVFTSSASSKRVSEYDSGERLGVESEGMMWFRSEGRDTCRVLGA
jgi:hypothetical protein